MEIKTENFEKSGYKKSVAKGSSIKCPLYAKDILGSVCAKRRSKTKGVCKDATQLIQLESLLLVCYLIEKDNEVYEKAISIDFPRELINKLRKWEPTKNV